MLACCSASWRNTATNCINEIVQHECVLHGYALYILVRDIQPAYKTLFYSATSGLTLQGTLNSCILAAVAALIIQDHRFDDTVILKTCAPVPTIVLCKRPVNSCK